MDGDRTISIEGGEVVDFPASSNIEELLADVEALVIGALDASERLDQLERSRELSLVRTKLEEAAMWLERITLPTNEVLPEGA